VNLDLDRAIGRVPRWIVVLGLLGTGAAGRFAGTTYAGAFFVGAAASYFNFRLIERFVNTLGRVNADGSAKPARNSGGYWLFVQFAVFVLGAFVILKSSGFNITVGFFGFLVCPAAAMVELIYELLTYGHS
jgi:hypothetical protein